MRNLLFCFIVVIFSLFSSCFVISISEKEQRDTITLGSLLKEMRSRESVVRWPIPEYTNKQFSSYDRKAKTPDSKDWFSNGDWSQFIRLEKRTENGTVKIEHVMFDAQGPGAIVRIWSASGELATLKEGILRIYIDDQKQPVIKGSPVEILSGEYLAKEPLAMALSKDVEEKRKSRLLYFPIPYSKRCKITFEEKSGAFMDRAKWQSIWYNINYRTYEKGTKVKSFSLKDLETYRKDITLTEQTLLASKANDFDKNYRDLEGKILQNQSKKILLTASKNGQAISGLKFLVKAKNLPQALRSTVLEIKFDDERTVWCPIGDFFGTGYQIRPTKSWYSEVKNTGEMYSHWIMPYRKKAEVILHNFGEQSVNLISAEVQTMPWHWDDRSMYFGSNWRQYTSIKAAYMPNLFKGYGAIDLNYVTLTGKGVYIGDNLTLFDTGGRWWGEGDEKIYVDGESFPSTFGTGTEDYYGYAWCLGLKFSTPFVAQPDGEGNTYEWGLVSGIGYTVNSRYRLLDGIPFKKSLRLDMELAHADMGYLDYAPTTRWYAFSNTKSNVRDDINSVKHPVALKVSDVFPLPVMKNGFIEGEDLRVVSIPSSVNVSVQSNKSIGWSKDRQLWFSPAKVNSKIVLDFSVPKKQAGRRNIEFALTKALDYGKIKITLNDNDKSSIEYQGYGELKLEKIKMSQVDIRTGRNTITLKILGKNPNSRAGMMVGLDYVKITDSLL